MDGTDWFGGLGDAETARSRGCFFAPGIYRVKIRDIVRKVSSDPQKPRGTRYFIVESEIVQVLQPQVGNDDYADSNQAGERPAWMQDLSRGEMALGNIKGFLSAFAGLDAASTQALEEGDWVELAMEASDAAVDIAERIGGIELIASAVRYTTQKGVKITLTSWSPIPSLDEAP